MLSLCLIAACATEESSGLGGGGGSRPADDGDAGVDDDEGEQGDEAPYINSVSAGFETTDEWIIRFEVDYDYSSDITGGTVDLVVTEAGADPSPFSLDIDGQYAPIDDGNIVFAINEVNPTRAYTYSIVLVSPEDTESDVTDGRVDPIQ
jgi:hypothetical protein